MTEREIRKYLQQWASNFEGTLLEFLETLEKRLRAVEGDMYTMLADLFREILDTDGGKITKNVRNVQRVTRIEQAFDRFTDTRVNDELLKFAEQLFQIGGLTAEYYTGLEMAKATQIQRGLDLLRAVIGIDDEGKLVKGGYLDKLGRSEQIRNEIRDYVVNSIVTQKKYTDFQNGLRTLVKGSKDVNGAMVRHWQTYAYDTYNQAHEVVNTAIAEDLELNYFVYQGSIIDTTRAFCRKKVGKVFSRDEALQWKNDPDLIDKKTAASYNPFLERGRYNCRHFLQWISDEMAAQLKGNDS